MGVFDWREAVKGRYATLVLYCSYVWRGIRVAGIINARPPICYNPGDVRRITLLELSCHFTSTMP
jgi:hypothetical protein